MPPTISWHRISLIWPRKRPSGSAKIDQETLDYIIVAHNFGDRPPTATCRSDFVPCLAARVKHKLSIVNPKTVAYDLALRLPRLGAGDHPGRLLSCASATAERVMVIGVETLSRISDPHDRDSMIYADGAGRHDPRSARDSDERVGILSHAVPQRRHRCTPIMLWMGKSCDPAPRRATTLYLKMDGHKLYEYALNTVPLVAKESLGKAGHAA